MVEEIVVKENYGQSVQQTWNLPESTKSRNNKKTIVSWKNTILGQEMLYRLRTTIVTSQSLQPMFQVRHPEHVVASMLWLVKQLATTVRTLASTAIQAIDSFLVFIGQFKFSRIPPMLILATPPPLPNPLNLTIVAMFYKM